MKIFQNIFHISHSIYVFTWCNFLKIVSGDIAMVSKTYPRPNILQLWLIIAELNAISAIFLEVNIVFGTSPIRVGWMLH